MSKKTAAPAPAPDYVTEIRVGVIALEDLRVYSRNARLHSADQIDQIVASIREFGWTNPLLIDVSDDGLIVAGHGRRAAAHKLYAAGEMIRLPDGRTLPPGTVPFVDCSGWTEEQRRAYTIADNKLAENATWDESLLKLELGELSTAGLDFDIGVIGFSSKEIGKLLGLDDAANGNTDPDDVPDVQDPVSALGDVWVLGDHRIICGDSTDAKTVTKVLAGERPHLMVTDPPYGVNYDPNWRNEAARSSEGMEDRGLGAGATGKVLNDDRADWRSAWALFPGDAAYVWHAGLFAQTVAESLIAEKFVLRSQIIWAKSNFAIGRGDYHWQHEPCWYAVRKGATGHWNGDRTQATLWEIAKPAKSETGHGTQKPVECMKRPIENNSEPGDAIYEPFSGSGTTIIAGEMTGRRVFAVELNPAYVDVAVRRWQDFTGKAAVHAESGRTFDEIAAERCDA